VKIAICGFASSSRDLAPYKDPAFEIWTMNHAAMTWCPKWDVMFELHTLEHLRTIGAHASDPNSYLAWLAKDHKRPIYTQRQFPEVPNSVAIPREELNAWFSERGGNVEGYFANDYYTSTISFMVALAIMKGAEEIHLYGIDLLQDEEYAYQRAGAEYLIGFARGMGIKTYVPRQSALCASNYTYGFSEPAIGLNSDDEKIKPLIDYLDDKANVVGGQLEQVHTDAKTYHGALQMADLALGWIEGKGLAPVLGEDQKPKVDEAGNMIFKTAAQMVAEKKDELAGKFNNAQASIHMLNGQQQAFKTSATWTKHFARGGALKS
jgi:hypothetical protein